MKYIAVDDELMAINIITNYASKIPYLELSGTFRNAISALDFLQNNKVDLLFLDINMPDFTGIQMLKTLSHIPLLIFTTAYSEYALEGYKFQAIDYLLKPIGFDEFVKAVNRAQEIFMLSKNKNGNPLILNTSTTTSDESNLLWVKSGTEYFKISLEEIMFIKSEGNYVEFHLRDKRIVSLDSLNSLLGKLPKDMFIRIHKSFIVSLKHIDSFERHQLKIKNETLPIGSIYREGFLQKIKP